MKRLMIRNDSVTPQALLEMAERIPGAWIGIRIAAMLLVLEGWKSTRIAQLFTVSRWSVVKWIRKVNKEGITGVPDHRRSGRPCRLNETVLKDLDEVLQRSPQEFGLKRNRWDGIVVIEYLERFHGVRLKVRQAQRWVRRLGFRLQRPVYRYVQATARRG